MNIIPYRSHLPAPSGIFTDRNPNISYLVTCGDKQRHSALIDASADPEAVAADLAEKKATLDYILMTHTHPDHTIALEEMARRFPGARVGVHRSSLRDMAGRGPADPISLENNMNIRLGDEALSVVHTPGHTFDSICLWNRDRNILFTGDTMFGGGIGCSDYSSGGNRNIFYQTIVYLLGILAPGTEIYPGHYSEHHRIMPPYKLDGEKEKNPYVVNAMLGRRGAFDRDLKEFSVEFENDDFVMMNESQIDRVHELEKAIWIPELQASRETILTRLRRGHQLLAIEKTDGLAGMVGWCYSRFSIDDSPDSFPRRFSDFSTCLPCPVRDARSAFIYNVGVRADARQSGTGSLLLQGAFEKIREAGIDQVFLDSRLPAYKGSRGDSHENVRQIPEFSAAIDRYFKDHRLPDESEFALDPRIRFYMMNGLRPWLILKDFVQDSPSDNMRVICYINLEQDRPRS